jgi:hypothetical protein
MGNNEVESQLREIDRRKTPVEVAGIKVEGENKWMTLIQNASKPKK